MFFERGWKTGFCVSARAPWLSSKTIAGDCKSSPKVSEQALEADYLLRNVAHRHIFGLYG